LKVKTWPNSWNNYTLSKASAALFVYFPANSRPCRQRLHIASDSQAGLEWTAEMFAYLFAGDGAHARSVPSPATRLNRSAAAELRIRHDIWDLQVLPHPLCRFFPHI
jgi:hypothetical protein